MPGHQDEETVLSANRKISDTQICPAVIRSKSVVGTAATLLAIRLVHSPTASLIAAAAFLGKDDTQSSGPRSVEHNRRRNPRAARTAITLLHCCSAPNMASLLTTFGKSTGTGASCEPSRSHTRTHYTAAHHTRARTIVSGIPPSRCGTRVTTLGDLRCRHFRFPLQWVWRLLLHQHSVDSASMARRPGNQLFCKAVITLKTGDAAVCTTVTSMTSTQPMAPLAAVLAQLSHPAGTHTL